MSKPGLIAAVAAGGLLLAGNMPAAGEAPLHWAPRGPRGGGVVSFAAVPASAGTVWAGIPRIGVWKSIDGGASWVRSGLVAPSEGTCLVVADAADPLTVYAATGGGLEKSADGGATWRLVGGSEPVVAFAVAPSASGVLYRAGLGPIEGPAPMARSDDGGATWQRIVPGLSFISMIAVDPSDARTVYVSGSYFHLDASPGFLVSRDGGARWTSSVLFDWLSSLVIDPRRPASLFAASARLGVIRSRDGGASWRPANGSLPESIQVNGLALDPATGVLYAALEAFGAHRTWQIWRSADDGRAWTKVLERGEWIQTVAVDPHLTGRVYAGTYGAGVLVSADGGPSWQVRNSGMEALGVEDLAADPHAAGTLYMIDQTANLIEKSTDAGATWASSFALPTWVTRVRPDPLTPGVVYAAAPGGPTLKSADGGQSWQAGGGLPFYLPEDLLADPARPDVLFVAGISNGQPARSAVARSRDGGASWQLALDIAQASTDFGTGFSTLVADPAAAAVYVGGRGGVWKSDDGGDTWMPLLLGLPAGQAVKRLALDAAGNLWAGLEGGPHTLFGPHSVYRSARGGGPWVPLDLGIPAGTSVRDLLADPRGTALYAATDRGIYVSRDGGGHWTAENAGLSELRVNRLAADSAHPGVVYAGTAAGVFVSPPPAGGCVADGARLCLAGGRFAAEVSWSLGDGTSGVGHGVELESNAGTFWFFDPASAEVMVRIVDGTAVNGHFWVFYAGLSDVAFTLTVTDTLTGARRTYANTAGRLASAADTSAFAGSGQASGRASAQMTSAQASGRASADHASGRASAHQASERASAETPSGCLPASDALCLQGSRFLVRAAWRLPGGGGGSALAAPLAQDTGAFWFFGPESLELLVKVIDGRAVNGHYWIFIAGLSDVSYTVTVSDTVSGASKDYRNRPGTLASRADTAF